MQTAIAEQSVQHNPLDRVLEKGVCYLSAQQEKDGSWPGDYGGPMFLLPMYIAANHIAGREIPCELRDRFITYYGNVQRPDGGIGLHAEGEGTMFTTALGYVSLRLLGLPAEDPMAREMLVWTHAHGTALASPSWGKFVLALLNLYDYEGLHPILPEFWILPKSLPFHPSRFWCHCRQVYLPMAYLYAKRTARPVDSLTEQLRQELYERPYDQIDFVNQRDTLCDKDRYVDDSRLLKFVNRVAALYERVHSKRIRNRALSKLLAHIEYEDRVTNFIRIGPVNAVLNTLVHYFNDPGGEATNASFGVLDEYIYDGHDGAKMQGYNSSALWDTAFAAQALLAAPSHKAGQKAIEGAYHYIKNNQVLEDVPDAAVYHRHKCRGGWPFSNRAHGWPITDCTAEGLKCALLLEGLVGDPIPDALLKESVLLLLSFQNPSGGWSTYELKRGPAWLEKLNPSQVFSDVIVDYPYVECTSACVQALVRARNRFPEFKDKEVNLAIERGVRFIRDQQGPDGGFEGSWAVCFTYGTWFAVFGLRAAGVPVSDPAIKRAAFFLLNHQNEDGGWGEHYSSCIEKRYVPSGESHVVNTAWALLTLVKAGRGDTEAAHRAARYLVEKQQENGDWPRQSLIGVFNKTALINYENYRRYFPIWALSLYRAQGDGSL